MSEMPLHVAAPAPVPEKTPEIDRTGEPVFELRSVSHSYGRNKVIFDVNLSVWPGEVVGLVGDNGAGKSTLLKIFAGYQRPTSGTLRFMGKDVAFRTPADARAMGIEAVYQDLAIVEQLSLWRNFFLGKEIVRNIGPLRVLAATADAQGSRGGDLGAGPHAGALGGGAGLDALGRRAAVGGDHAGDAFRRQAAPARRAHRGACRYARRAMSSSRSAAPATTASACSTSTTT